MSRVKHTSPVSLPGTSDRASRQRRVKPLKCSTPPPPPRKDPMVEYWAEKVRQMPEVREDLVAQVAAEIDSGKYETPEKLRIAVARMLEELL